MAFVDLLHNGAIYSKTPYPHAILTLPSTLLGVAPEMCTFTLDVVMQQPDCPRFGRDIRGTQNNGRGGLLRHHHASRGTATASGLGPGSLQRA